MSQLALNPAEDFWFTGANGAKVQGFLVKPPNWQAGKKYPAILLIHGGPQGAWLDKWHGRWNYQMFAATGAALVIINPRGSTGYGQKFVDDVSKDWGGKVYTDLMNGLDAALAKYTVDRSRRARRGGRIVRWLHGELDRRSHDALQGARVARRSVQPREHGDGDRRALVPGLGVRRSVLESEGDGDRSIASTRRISSCKNFKTPTLVTGGELDYRVPYTEDLSMFTSLQRMNVPSRLVMFPDEGHWIGKPQNQRLWWGEVQGWLEEVSRGEDESLE